MYRFIIFRMEGDSTSTLQAYKAASEGNGPVHQEEEFGFGQPAPVDEFREIRSQFDKLKELMRRLIQHL